MTRSWVPQQSSISGAGAQKLYKNSKVHHYTMGNTAQTLNLQNLKSALACFRTHLRIILGALLPYSAYGTIGKNFHFSGAQNGMPKILSDALCKIGGIWAYLHESLQHACYTKTPSQHGAWVISINCSFLCTFKTSYHLFKDDNKLSVNILNIDSKHNNIMAP